MSKRDYYEVLGVGRSADEQAIRSAFRKKAGDFHPDRHPGASAEEKKKLEEKFKELGEAYEVLSDKDKRAKYDQFGHAAASGQGGGQWRGGGGSPFEGFGGFEDMFGDIMEGMFGGQGGGRGRQAQRGSDLRAEVELSFEDAAKGKEVVLELNRMESCGTCGGSGAKKGSKPVTCSRCRGQGRVQVSQGFFSMVTACPDCGGRGEVIKDACSECRGQGRLRARKQVKVAVPAGVDNGIQIRKRGEGEAGPQGGPHGDLYLNINVRPHPLFTRDGEDLLCEVPVSFAQAALGAELEVPTLEGRVRLKVPAGTQSGKVFRLKGKGVEDLNGNGKGDLLVTVTVETPGHLTPKQKELLEEFAKISGEEDTPRRKSFLDKAKELFT